MDLQLKGQSALVTGSTAGIGYAIAHALASEGARVTINGRTQAAVDKALSRLRAEIAGADVKGVAADAGTAAGPFLIGALVGVVPLAGAALGVATVGGEVYFDPGYDHNILVNAFTLGVVPAPVMTPFGTNAKSSRPPLVASVVEPWITCTRPLLAPATSRLGREALSVTNAE